MNMTSLIQAVLLVLVRYAVVAFFALINVIIDPVIFDSIVAGIVTVLLALFGVEVTAKLLPVLRKRGFLKE